MSLLIISNGHGEDSIANNLIQAYQASAPNHPVIACPIVGKGHSYHQNKIQTLLENPTFPSGGFIRSLSDLYHDLKKGLITHILHQRKAIKDYNDNTLTIAVGDVFCLWLASINKKPLFFLPTAKSDNFMPHSIFERNFIRNHATHSFPRDQQTTNSFLKHNLPASYYGNPMMDALITTEKFVNNPKNSPIIGLLPGSRDEGYQNFNYMLELCETFYNDHTHIIFGCALADTLDIQKISAESHWIYNLNSQTLTSPKNNCTILITKNFKALINQATCIIGLAGTANEQAVQLGKPVICFKGFGPQSTLKRFHEQQKLMGKNIIVCSDRNKATILATLNNTIQNKSISNSPTPQGNASEAIINHIINH